MRRKMLFRIGLSVVIFVSVLLFYYNNSRNQNRLQKLKVGEQYVPVEQIDGLIAKYKENDTGKKGSDPIDESRALNGETEDKDRPEKGGGVEEKTVLKKDKKPHEHSKILHSSAPGLNPVLQRVGKLIRNNPKQALHVSVVACGDRGEETLVLLKSAVLFTGSPLVFHIFAEKELQNFFQSKLDFWPENFLEKIEYNIYDITFPSEENADEWKKLFKLCASQRLFLPSLLMHVDSLVYVDTDIIFLSPLEELWSFFARFNSTQLVALAPEHEDANVGWYNRFARHPFYGSLGVNSGVMLMNLTRLRETTWMSSILKYYKEYRLKITWGDQDLINIYFHYHPDQLYEYSCEWNYRPDHCMYMSVCKTAEKDGAYVVHGCRRVMHNDKQPAFKAIYDTFKQYQLGDNIETQLLENLKKNLQSTSTTPCGKVGSIFLQQVEKFVAKQQPFLAKKPIPEKLKR